MCIFHTTHMSQTKNKIVIDALQCVTGNWHTSLTSILLQLVEWIRKGKSSPSVGPAKNNSMGTGWVNREASPCLFS